MKFAHAAFDEDPEKDQTTHDIILWSGLSPYEQTHFAPEKFKNGETALLLGNMWVSDLLTKIPTFEWGNEDCKDKIKTFRGNTSPADDERPFCNEGCGWHPDMTIKPWEAISRALVKHFESSSGVEKGQKQEIFVLLKKWSVKSVFASTEIKAFMEEEMRKMNTNNHAGGLNFRIARHSKDNDTGKKVPVFYLFRDSLPALSLSLSLSRLCICSCPCPCPSLSLSLTHTLSRLRPRSFPPRPL